MASCYSRRAPFVRSAIKITPDRSTKIPADEQSPVIQGPPAPEPAAVQEPQGQAPLDPTDQSAARNVTRADETNRLEIGGRSGRHLTDLPLTPSAPQVPDFFQGCDNRSLAAQVGARSSALLPRLLSGELSVDQGEQAVEAMA